MLSYRYEAQSEKLKTVEAEKRALEVQVLRSGGASGDVGGASRPGTAATGGALTPASRRASLGGWGTGAKRRASALPAELREMASSVQRKLEAAGEDGAVGLVSPQAGGAAGRENAPRGTIELPSPSGSIAERTTPQLGQSS